MLARATKALTVWARAGFPVVDEATLKQRLDRCFSCPLLERAPAGLSRLAGAGEPVCGGCGCPVGRKARLATERCPNGNWE